MPNSNIEKFGQWIVGEYFNEFKHAKTSTEKVMALQYLIQSKYDEIFPVKQIKIFDRDQEWMTEEIQNVRREKRIQKKSEI